VVPPVAFVELYHSVRYDHVALENAEVEATAGIRIAVRVIVVRATVVVGPVVRTRIVVVVMVVTTVSVAGMTVMMAVAMLALHQLGIRRVAVVEQRSSLGWGTVKFRRPRLHRVRCGRQGEGGEHRA
jgi:hypothetical protein